MSGNIPYNPSTVVGGRGGQYGKTLPVVHTPTVSMGGRSPGLLSAENTNSYVSFGNAKKRQRNIERTRGVFRTNVSPVFRGPNTPSESGQKVWQTYPAPSVQAWLHLTDRDEKRNTTGARVTWAQSPQEIVRASRINANRMHSALIRPAAPAQPNWKTSYIIGQRNVQPIGPYQSMAQKSIIQRVGTRLGVTS
jgi:hypothetical protein